MERQGSNGFFYPLGYRHARHACKPNDTALKVAPAQQNIDLSVLRGLAYRQLAQRGLGNGRPYTGKWVDRFYCRNTGRGNYRMWLKNVTYKS